MPFPATPGSAWPGQITPGDPGALPNIVNQWPATVTNDPGLAQANVSNSSGNGLVAFIGWNDSTFPVTGYVTVADDAHNYWQPLGLSPGTTDRCAIWIATKADPATVVSVSSSLPVSGMAALIVEMNGLPALVGTDFAPVSSAVSATSVSLSATAGAADWVFGVAVSNNNTDTITGPSAPWTALNTVSVNDPLSGAGGAADTKITPVYAKVSPGALAPSWGSSGVLQFAALITGITQASPVVTNTGNPNWPVFQVQAAFGAQAGNGQTPPTWTDITSRAIFDDSATILDVTGGRSYELTGPESGTILVWLNNQDGALTPGNSASPYYPNVLPETPLRVIATWSNKVYAVASGKIDKWPQSFPSEQWGFVNSSASDGMGILANLTLNSAYQSEVLLDQPYSYWPLAESYGEANGLPFENLGSNNTNTKPMVGVDGQSTGSVPLSTGLSLNLVGDSGSGIGLSGLTANPDLWSSGAACVDPGLTTPLGGGVVSVEFWASTDTAPPTGGSFLTPLVSLLGPPTNFGSGGGPVRFQVAIKSGSPLYTMQVTIANFAGASYTNSTFTYPNDGNPHHHVFTVSGTTVSHYLDGAFDLSVTSSVNFATATDIYQVVLGPALITPLTSNPFNYVLAHVAVYGTALAAMRVQSHYKSGIMGWANETALARFKRIMAWSQAHLPMAATAASAAPLMGAAFSIGGQAGTDSLNDLIVSEGGWPYADKAGNVWWASRASFYNRQPKWVLSDNPADGGIFYDPGQSFDFDNSFLYTQAQAVRSAGQSTQITTSATKGVSAQTFQSTGAQVTTSSPSARTAYGNRNALQQTILTANDQDVYDRLFWSLSKYSASSLRIPQIVINAAANPALWPVVLGAEQGDIVKVIRRPLGGAAYTVLGIVVQTHVEVGVNKGQVTLGIVPYSIEASILKVDDPTYGTLANGIGW